MMSADVSSDDNQELREAIDETRELNRQRSGMDLHYHGVHFNIEFGPLEHPMEPSDEDRPVKYPMPSSSFINMDREMKEERRLGECCGKRAEFCAGVNMEGNVFETTEPPGRAVRKRHHKLTYGDHIVMPLTRMPPSPTQNVTVFQMLQQLDKFDS